MDSKTSQIISSTEKKHELLKRLLQKKGIDLGQTHTIPRRDQPTPAPLSFTQQELWLFDQLEGPSSIYNVPTAWRFRGRLDIAALERSLTEIIRRHESLRTTFTWAAGKPVQIINPTPDVILPVVDLQHFPKDQKESEVQRLVMEAYARPIDLENGPILKFALFRLAPEHHVLLLIISHIAFDGWSQGIFTRELCSFYEAVVEGRPNSLPDLPIQYADFACWQRSRYAELEDQLAYWKKQLAGAPHFLNLPTDRPRPPVQRFRCAVYTSALPEDLSKRLKTLGLKLGVTPFAVLKAAFAILLSRYSGQEDMLIAAPNANRHHAELEPLIGFFLTTFVLRIRMNGDPTFRELITKVGQIALEAYQRPDVSYELLVETLQPARSLSYNPIFQVMFLLQNFPKPQITLPGLSPVGFTAKDFTATFDLLLSIKEDVERLETRWEYNSDLFDATTIQRMDGQFQSLLARVVANPDQRISHLPLLTSAEEHRLFVEWNNTQADDPQDTCIHQRFEEQVERTPDGVAVVCDAKESGILTPLELTYRELNARANQLAHYLQSLGVGPETLVGICVERSPEMAVAWLGVLKAGGACVPLHPTSPQQLLACMLEDAQPKVVLTQQHLIEDLLALQSKVTDRARGTNEQIVNPHVICLDTEWPAIAKKRADNPISEVQPENLAYVIYTSGVTDTPKGVMIPHRALINQCYAIATQLALTEKDRVLQFASLGCDVVAAELFPTWSSGASVVLPPQGSSPVAELTQVIALQRITVLHMPAAYWHKWVSMLARYPVPASVRMVVVGSDKMWRQQLTRWQKQAGTDVSLRHAYGMSEATITTTLYDPNEQEQGKSHWAPIGRPIANAQVYLLDHRQRPVPIGVPGELYIGGAGLARGYLNQPKLTEERFVDIDDLPSLPCTRESNIAGACRARKLFKTGDLARYLPDGNLEFLSRIEDQVEIDNVRFQLGEIEAVLNEYPELEEAVVIVQEEQTSRYHLVAYIVPQQQIEPNILHAFLKSKLPSYMVPSTYMQLEALPRLPSGKVDRLALRSGPHKACTRSPRKLNTATEEALTLLWCDVLGVEEIGLHDSFFALGGSSLLGVQLMRRLQNAFSVELPLRRLYEYPTVAELSAYLDIHAKPATT